MESIDRACWAIWKASPNKKCRTGSAPPKNHLCLGELDTLEIKIYNAWQQQKLFTALAVDDVDEGLRDENDWALELEQEGLLWLFLYVKIRGRLNLF
jgi:hypothetical protein